MGWRNGEENYGQRVHVSSRAAPSRLGASLSAEANRGGSAWRLRRNTAGRHMFELIDLAEMPPELMGWA